MPIIKSTWVLDILTPHFNISSSDRDIPFFKHSEKPAPKAAPKKVESSSDSSSSD